MTSSITDFEKAALQRLEIPSPCTESWDAMTGNDQVRHCGLCKKNVFNLSAMPEAEATALVAGNVDGALCVRFYRRSDGTVMTSDCGTNPRVMVRRTVRMVATVAGVGAAGAALLAAAALAHAGPETDHSQVTMGAPPAVAQPVEVPPPMMGEIAVPVAGKPAPVAGPVKDTPPATSDAGRKKNGKLHTGRHGGGERR